MRRGGEAFPGLRPGPKRLLQARRSRGFPCHQPTISMAWTHKNDAELLHTMFYSPAIRLPSSPSFLKVLFLLWPLSRSLANLKGKKKIWKAPVIGGLCSPFPPRHLEHFHPTIADLFLDHSQRPRKWAASTSTTSTRTSAPPNMPSAVSSPSSRRSCVRA